MAGGSNSPKRLLRDREGGDLDLCYTVIWRDTDLLRCGGREIHDSPVHVRSPILNGRVHALAGLQIAYFGGGAEWQRLARPLVWVDIAQSTVQACADQGIGQLRQCFT